MDGGFNLTIRLSQPSLAGVGAGAELGKNENDLLSMKQILYDMGPLTISDGLSTAF